MSAFSEGNISIIVFLLRRVTVWEALDAYLASPYGSDIMVKCVSLSWDFDKIAGASLGLVKLKDYRRQRRLRT